MENKSLVEKIKDYVMSHKLPVIIGCAAVAVVLVAAIILAIIFLGVDPAVKEAKKLYNDDAYVAALSALDGVEGKKAEELRSDIEEDLLEEIEDLLEDGKVPEAMELIKGGEGVEGIADLLATAQHICEHKFDQVDAKKATCTEDGYESYECTVCDLADSFTLTAYGHNLTEGEVTKEATCAELGELTKTCIVCQENIVEPIEKLPHTNKEKVTKKPTCSEEGVAENTCTVCGEKSTAPIEKVAHTYEEKVTKKPTCVDKGEMTLTCKVCKDKTTNPVDTVDHKYKETVTKEAGCLTNGEKTVACTVCGDSSKKSIPATGHKYEETIIGASCTETGEKKYTCSGCGDTYSEKVYATGHNWQDATCTAPRTCSNCGETSGSARGHRWEDATYEAPKTCKTCGATEGSALASPKLVIKGVPGTYIEYNWNESVDQKVTISEVSYKIEHSYGNTYRVYLYFTGEKTYDDDGSGRGASFDLSLRLFDSEGYVVTSSTYYTPNLRMGEKFRNDEDYFYADLTSGTYTLEIGNTI